MMKKIILISVAMLLSIHAKAQKYLEVYQNGKVAASIATSSIDSIGLTGNSSSDRKVNFYRGRNIVNSYLASDVDSIKVFRSEEEPLVYMGIVGFNQKLYHKPIDVLASSTSRLFTDYVNNLSSADGTLLYYAVDYALDMMKSKTYDTPLTSVNLITFTDGLDQGSLMMNESYSTEEQYLNALSSKIQTTRVKGLPLTAYSIGLRGSDVSNYNMFKNNLNKLASSSDKAFEANSMSAVSTRLQEISDQIISISNRQTISLKIPGRSNGTLVRFTFDGYSPASSSLYIEGTFNLSSRSLSNVTYHGIKAASGSYVQGTQDGIFVTFTFTGLQREDGNGLIPTNYIREYYKSTGSTEWQQNSEFSPANNTQTTVTHSGAAIILALDCSSSLGSQFGNMKSYARDFISRVAGNTAPYSVDAPKNVTASIKESDFTIDVSWDAVKHAESYDVYRSGSSSSGFSKVASGITSTTWNDAQPLSGSNYYRVYAVGHGLTSSASATTPVVSYALDSPKNVTATYDENTEFVTVSWNPVTYAENYDVYRNGSLLAENISNTTYVDNSPNVGRIMYYVKAKRYNLVSMGSETTTPIFLGKDAIKVSVKGVDFYMVKVSGGTFTMGATSEQGSDYDSDERPIHQVTLSDYLIGETEVTQELWEAVMGSNPSSFKGAKLPVECVSWIDCQTFIAKLNQLTGRKFRLPTEAEWENAARGGSKSKGYKYAGSNTLGDVAWYGSNSSGKTHDVATKQPNELGLYDMSGNVWEWCQDWYGSYSSSAQTNPTGPTSGSYCVRRGGSWDRSAGDCRVSIRYCRTPGLGNYYIGLRLAL